MNDGCRHSHPEGGGVPLLMLKLYMNMFVLTSVVGNSGKGISIKIQGKLYPIFPRF